MNRRRVVAVAGRIAIAYLVAALVATVVFYERGNGHADVPFTTFPEYLFVFPVIPPVLVAGAVVPASRLMEGAGREHRLAAAVFAGVFAAAWLAGRALGARLARAREARPRST